MGETDNIPHHVAIIMDGNGRWARERGLDRSEGHVRGAAAVYDIVRASREWGVAFLTLYVFSTENWNRPQSEVEAIMKLFCANVEQQSAELIEQGVRVVLVGSREGLSQDVLDHWDRIERATAEGDKLTLGLAMNYSSRSELVQVVRSVARDVASGALDPETITDQSVVQRLFTYPMPDPDLVIRTGGEYRLSNFLLWQAAYAELYFCDVLWPDFDRTCYRRAIDEYGRRNRRFGAL